MRRTRTIVASPLQLAPCSSKIDLECSVAGVEATRLLPDIDRLLIFTAAIVSVALIEQTVDRVGGCLAGRARLGLLGITAPDRM